MNFIQFVDRFPNEKKRMAAVHGADEFLVSMAVKLLKSQYMGDEVLDYRSFNLTESYREFEDAIHEQPINSKNLVVVGANFESKIERLNAIDWETVPKTTVPILWSEKDKISTKQEFPQRVIQKGYWIWCRPLDGDETVHALREMYKVPNEIAEKLVMYFTHLSFCISEARKLATIGALNARGFETLSAKPRVSEDMLMDFISKGDTPRAVQMMESLLESGEAPLRVIGTLAYKVEQTLRASAILSSGGKFQDVVLELGIPKGFVPAVMDRARRIHPVRGVQMFQTLERASFRIRMGEPDIPVMLQMVVELAGY